VSGLGAPLHVHLHDGHPLHPGLSDHRGFLTRMPVPFARSGRFSLEPLCGPSGLAGIVGEIRRAAGRTAATMTLEIHQGLDRLSVFHAADLFPHWRDLTNAERMNAWLAELARNADLVRAVLAEKAQDAAASRPRPLTSPPCVAAAAGRFPGHLGAHVHDSSHPTATKLVIVFGFATAAQLAAWEASTERAEWLERADQLSEGGQRTQTVENFAALFATPG